MISFHTPQLPNPLGLDLAQLSGGGSCPSQFYGRTHDQREVYVRYRGGYLSVHIADKTGEDAVGASPVLEVDVGPLLDGSISLMQFCRYFGVTVDGVVPEEVDPEAHTYSDLSGTTTFWQVDITRVTVGTSRKILLALRESFPKAILLQVERDGRNGRHKLVEVPLNELKDAFWLIDGASSPADVDTSPEVYVLPKVGQLQISGYCRLWRYPEPTYTSMGVDRASEELGRTLIEAGVRSMPEAEKLAYDSFTIRSKFPTLDNVVRSQLSRLGDRLLNFLPETRLERVDLKSGQVLTHVIVPFDPVIVDWCNSGSDRWVSISREERGGPWTGVRPVKN